MNGKPGQSAKAVAMTAMLQDRPLATAAWWRSLGTAAMALAIASTNASPAQAALACRKWDFYNSTMFMKQSNGFTVGVTFGRAERQETVVLLGVQGSAFVQDKSDRGIPQNAHFTRSNGFLQFEVLWQAGAANSSRGLYSANPANIRSIDTGDLRGGLIADLSGRTSGYTNADVAFATWSTPDRIFCPPEEVYDTTGNLQRRAEAPTVAPVQAFAGGWNTMTDQGGRFTLILNIAGPGQNPMLTDIYVTGQFIATDGTTKYNGILQGTIPKGSRMLVYEYSQPESNAGGRGQFTLSNDGNTITGNGQAGELSFTWNGTRAK